MGVFRPCEGCAARSEEIAHLRHDLEAARADAAAARSSAEAERRDLTTKLTALADVRAASIVKDPGRRSETSEAAKRGEVRYPPAIASLIGGGHVDVGEIRRRMTQTPVKAEVPQVATS